MSPCSRWAPVIPVSTDACVDVAFVSGGGDAREVAQDAVKPSLKLIMQSYAKLWPPSRHVHASWDGPVEVVDSVLVAEADIL